MTDAWQRSSYCGEGEACMHISSAENSVHLTESGDPHGVVIRTIPTAFAALTHALKSSTPPSPSGV
ncbi:DUF397 domain-containing protein [Streptomyces sp. NPDC021093]|uniref:DUF397 domain-containing protein n=1 Tax=Streptomyces sp. NPDC021093 TaxID=3365112 RepID=UPI0037BA67B5